MKKLFFLLLLIGFASAYSAPSYSNVSLVLDSQTPSSYSNVSLVLGEATGDSAPTYSSNSTNSTLAGEPVEHRLKWEDDTALSGYIFSFCNGTYNGSA